jgi:hypothetical protein
MALLPNNNPEVPRIPLLANTLSEKECRRIERPALQVALNASALPSNFPGDVLYAPPQIPRARGIKDPYGSRNQTHQSHHGSWEGGDYHRQTT